MDQAEQNHTVLRTCLDEIDRNRPFFLGLLGDRSGKGTNKTPLKPLASRGFQAPAAARRWHL